MGYCLIVNEISALFAINMNKTGGVLSADTVSLENSVFVKDK